MCDSGGGDEKRRYFVGPFEDPACGLRVLMSLELALDDLRSRFEEGEIGDVLQYKLVEMTEREIEKLPEV